MSTVNVIVLHGLHSTPPNGAALAITKSVQCVVTAPHLNHRSFFETKDKIDAAVLDSLRDINYYDTIVVGSSMGGFWAYYCARKYSLKCVLINPALDIKPILEKNDFSDVTKKQYLDLEKRYGLKQYNTGTYVDLVLGEYDNVVDIEALRKNFPSWTMVEEGHRLENYDVVIQRVNAAINNLS